MEDTVGNLMPVDNNKVPNGVLYVIDVSQTLYAGTCLLETVIKVHDISIFHLQGLAYPGNRMDVQHDIIGRFPTCTSNASPCLCDI